MKVYIAGKITGDPNYKDNFYDGKRAMEMEGHTVLNPADLPEGMRPADYMRICFAMIDCSDVVAFLPDWQYSRGAALEYQYCQYVGKEIVFLEEVEPYRNLTKPRCGIGF